jgi:hypothetical protein
MSRESFVCLSSCVKFSDDLIPYLLVQAWFPPWFRLLAITTL